jgi:hypothetical protein
MSGFHYSQNVHGEEEMYCCENLRDMALFVFKMPVLSVLTKPSD